MKSRLNPVYINNIDESSHDTFDFSSEIQSNERESDDQGKVEAWRELEARGAVVDTCEELQQICGECTESTECMNTDNNCNSCNMEKDRMCCRIESVQQVECETRMRYNPGVDYFESMITPVMNLHSRYSKTRGLVEFRMRRKNKTVTLQWESFQGLISGSKITHLTVTQSIANLPGSPKIWPICINYGNQIQQGWLDIDPHEINGQIRFYLNTDKSNSHIHANDWFSIPSSSVTWIVD